MKKIDRQMLVVNTVLRNYDSGYSSTKHDSDDAIYRDGFKNGFLEALDYVENKRKYLKRFED